MSRSKRVVIKNYTELKNVATSLSRFLKSDSGKKALKLLKTTQIVLAYSPSGGCYGDTYFFDEHGFQKSHEAIGAWVSLPQYADQIKPPEISSLTPEKAIEVAAHLSGIAPSNFLSWFKQTIDYIASEKNATR